MLSHQRQGVDAVGSSLLLRNTAICSMLHAQYLTGIPGGNEDVTEHTSMPAGIPVEIHHAFPWNDGGQVRRLQSCHLPLGQGIVRDP